MRVPATILDSRSLPAWRALWADLVAGLDEDGLRLRFFSASREGARKFCLSALPEKVLFAVSCGEVIGAADVHLVGDTVEIGVCVGKAFRGQGVGGALVDAALREPPAGASRAVLHHLPENAAIRRICAARSAVTRVEDGVIRAEIDISPQSDRSRGAACFRRRSPASRPAPQGEPSSWTSSHDTLASPDR